MHYAQNGFLEHTSDSPVIICTGLADGRFSSFGWAACFISEKKRLFFCDLIVLCYSDQLGVPSAAVAALAGSMRVVSSATHDSMGLVLF
jgi:hypothetical protein